MPLSGIPAAAESLSMIRIMDRIMADNECLHGRKNYDIIPLCLRNIDQYGWFPERPKGTDCKSAALCFGGSNPPPPIAGVAELADARDLKSRGGDIVSVRARPPAVRIKKRLLSDRILFLYLHKYNSLILNNR
jgi:hypothetical protein